MYIQEWVSSVWAIAVSIATANVYEVVNLTNKYIVVLVSLLFIRPVPNSSTCCYMTSTQLQHLLFI